MMAGKFNREVEIQSKGEGQDDDYGTSDGEWEPFTTVWAEVKDVLPSRSETIGEGVELARRPCRVRMHFRDDITSKMRLLVKGVPAYGLPERTLLITAGPAEIGFREGIEFMAEELTTKGAGL